MKATEKQAKKVKKKLPIYYKVGRPSKYKPIYCKKIIEYFDVPISYDELVIKYNSRGDAYEELITKPTMLPSLDRFAMEINVDQDTLKEWKRVHPEFSVAFNRAKRMQKDFLVKQCSYGFITPSYAVFLTKAMTDLNDVASVDITSGGEKVENFNLTSYIKELKDKDIDGLQREAAKQVNN